MTAQFKYFEKHSFAIIKKIRNINDKSRTNHDSDEHILSAETDDLIIKLIHALSPCMLCTTHLCTN